MNTRMRSKITFVLVASTVALAACGDRSDNAAVSRTEGTKQSVANATDRATTRAAVAVDDAAITTKVKAAVLAEPGLKSLAIDVDTKDGVVTLAGSVQSPELKERAVTLAQRVDGVRSVQDQLVIKPT